MNILLDTCALLWLTLEPDALSQKAHSALSNAEELLVSSISIWEIGIKAKQKAIDLGTSFPDYVDRVSNAQRLRIMPVDTQNWVKSLALDWKHRDPADRVIVALADMLQIPIITEDKQIRRYYPQVVW
ncbi:MAG: type II toxin-antitoxin system VapC family toxin [Proteobacteria bacterium]|nr:type II toxin-antitoxin system VapC family toxin [Pseudomonadota bacterium]